MSSPPRVREPVTVSPPSPGGYATRLRRLPLSQRLPQMSDERLRTLRQAAMEISQDEEHPRKGRAAVALPQIDVEIARRANLANVGSKRLPDGDRAND